MPKFKVVIIETRELVHAEVEAENAEVAGELAKGIEPSGITVKDRIVGSASRILLPQEIAYKMQIDGIQRDYQRLKSEGKMPSGEDVDEASAITILQHLAQLHDALIDTSGLDIPKIASGDTIAFFKEHLGDPTAPKPERKGKPLVLSEEEKQAVWDRCATAFGWEWDPDYKGWIKRANKLPGKIHGEWDAYPRDLTSEDACAEEGIDTVEEAREAVLGQGA